MAFLIPIAIILIAFNRLEVYPFGDKSLLSFDFWAQYFPMMSQKHFNKLNFISNAHTWNGAMGNNIYAQNVYYTASPLNALLLLVQRDYLIQAVDYIILLRYGLASVTFLFFLNDKYKKVNAAMVAVAITYALSSYALAYIHQPMWQDSYVLLPLLVVGLTRLVRENKVLFYIGTLTLTIYTNFYIAFSVSIFIALYFVVLMVINLEQFDLNEVKAKVKIFGVSSLISGGLNAFMILPVVIAVNQTIQGTGGFPKPMRFYDSAVDYLSHLLPYTELTNQSGIPNIYSGTLILICIPIYFTLRNIKLKERVAHAALLLVLYLSLNLNVLDYVWHGFHIPDNFVGRWSFVFSFLVLILAYEVIEHMSYIETRVLIIIYINSIIVLSIFHEIRESLKIQAKSVLMTAVIITLFVILFLSSRFFIFNNKKKSVQLLIALLIITNQTRITPDLLERDGHTSGIELYNRNNESMSIIRNLYDDEEEFYRMEMADMWTFNPSQLYQYKGITMYTSMMRGDAYEFFKKYGNGNYGYNKSSIFYEPYSPVFNSLMGIKYITKRDGVFDAPYFEKIYHIGTTTVYKNNRVLPVAFMMHKSKFNLQTSELYHLENQNKLIRYLADIEEDVFERIEFDTTEVVNAEVDTELAWESNYYTRVDQSQPIVFNYVYSPRDGEYLYLDDNFRAGKITVTIGEEVHTEDISFNQYIYLGEQDEGVPVNISIEVDNINLGLYGIHLYKYNLEALEGAFNKLMETPAQNIHYDESSLNFTIDARKSGILYTSVPADEGWRVKIDGEVVKPIIIDNYLIGLIMPAGKHTVEMSYWVPGLLEGGIISLLSMIGFLFFMRHLLSHKANEGVELVVSLEELDN
nr:MULTISPECIES: YfhO family protein [unclassified Fusibacter]